MPGEPSTVWRRLLSADLMQAGVAVRADFTLHGRTPWASFRALSQR
ncbi:hypothetical protein ACWC2M_10635 [Streptomyces sp. NPDC001761]